MATLRYFHSGDPIIIVHIRDADKCVHDDDEIDDENEIIDFTPFRINNGNFFLNKNLIS